MYVDKQAGGCADGQSLIATGTGAAVRLCTPAHGASGPRGTAAQQRHQDNRRRTPHKRAVLTEAAKQNVPRLRFGFCSLCVADASRWSVCAAIGSDAARTRMQWARAQDRRGMHEARQTSRQARGTDPPTTGRTTNAMSDCNEGRQTEAHANKSHARLHRQSHVPMAFTGTPLAFLGFGSSFSPPNHPHTARGTRVSIDRRGQERSGQQGRT